MTKKELLQKLPYKKPFLFVDEITAIDENGAKGTFLFNEDLDFYKGHFAEKAVTPGVILTECCAQIGLVCLGIYLLNDADIIAHGGIQIGLSSSQMDFYEPVFPNEKVLVVSEKVYFRFNKLKCKVKMYNANEELVCKGVISGMLKMNENG